MNASSPLEVKSGSAFRADELELTWLGQSAFHLRTESTGVLIDPWFSDHSERLVPTAVPAILGSEVDYVLVTHEHVDHFVIVTVYAFRSFDFIYVMTQGGPGTASMTLPYLAYRDAWRREVAPAGFQ